MLLDEPGRLVCVSRTEEQRPRSEIVVTGWADSGHDSAVVHGHGVAVKFGITW